MQRGRRERSERLWRSEQYAKGRKDALAGRPGRYSDQHYQRGYRAGLAKLESSAGGEA